MIASALNARETSAMAVVLSRVCLVLAFAASATAAVAADYVVVRSTDPALQRGQAFDAGVRVPLAAGATVTLMHASGDIVTLRAAADGVSLPRRTASAPDADRMAVLKFILARAPKDADSRGLRTRGAICPAAETITTLDAVAQVYQSGCADQAADALNALLAPGLDAQR
jgi:hypothetical protein